MTTSFVYDNYEISGCQRLDDAGRPDPRGTSVETCDDAEAHFWTLYGHITGQGVEAIGDFSSRQAAEEVYHRITGQPFGNSHEVKARLRLMHAGPALLTACRMVIDRWERGDLAEATRACSDAVARATDTCPPWEADESYSVLLLYPDYANDSGTETYYAFVKAPDPDQAITLAQRQAAAAQEGIEIEPDDFLPLLVTQGHHFGEPLFNK